MTPRARKLVGTVLLLVLVTVYALLVMVLVASLLPRLGKIWEIAFYAVAGFAWTVPAGLLIRWMHRTPG